MAIIQHSHISLPRSVELNWHASHQGWLADFRFSSISFLCVSFRLWYLAVSFMGLLGLFPLLPASGNFCLLWSFSIWPQQVSSFSFPSLLTVLAWLVWSGPWSCCSSASIWNLSYIFTKKNLPVQPHVYWSLDQPRDCARRIPVVAYYLFLPCCLWGSRRERVEISAIEGSQVWGRAWCTSSYYLINIRSEGTGEFDDGSAIMILVLIFVA